MRFTVSRCLHGLWNGLRVLSVVLLLALLLIRGRQWINLAVGLPVGDDRLIRALASGDAAELRRALAEGADAEAELASGTPLLLAASGSNPQLVRELLAHGANPTTAAASRNAPLHLAALNGRVENVRLLLEAGADIDAATDRQVTPLICAARAGHLAVVTLLLERGARFDGINNPRRILVEVARQPQADPEVFRLLIDAGAMIDAGDADGVTPLQAARQAGRDDLIAILREHSESGERPPAARPVPARWTRLP